MKFNELTTIEKYIIQFLTKILGYEYLKPEECKKLRQFETEYLLYIHLLDAIKKLNDITDDTIADTVLREVKKVDTNEEFLKIIRNGVNLIDATTRKTKNYKIIDLKNPDNNRFVVTNQFYFEGDTENIRPDILLFVNGIPLVDIEAKSPTVSAHVDYQKAIGQLSRYYRVARKLFIPNAFNIATDGVTAVYGATGAPAQYYLSWRDEELSKKYDENPIDIILAGLLEKERFCDILENFVVFEATRDGNIKKVARYQQLRAANKILERVKEGKTHNGLVWHTQGSGKTLTMFFTAWKLRFDPTLHNPKIFILVDRIDLDDQVYKEFVNHGGEAIIRITSRKDLEKHIASVTRGIFISTIQKFAELGNEVKNLSENIIILSDEAHRGDEGVAGINVRASMGKAYFFGFTGTPIDKKTLNTHRNYGEEGERYLDYYSIAQAIEDGATLPVTYEARLSQFAIDEGNIDEQFLEMTHELNDNQRNELLKKHTKKSALVKLPKRMQMIAQDILEHFRVYVEPSGFKAQVVCYDREATAIYKKLFDKLIPAEWSAVVYSSGDPNSENPELAEYNTSKTERDAIIKNFKNPEHQLKILLVCDMLLTGFDAPIEQVMYLDKPLRDHTLLQAIARTNRVYPHKEAGKIIDYYGITRNLYNALDFSEDVVDAAMINIEEVKERFKSNFVEVMDLFQGVNTEDPTNENFRNTLKIFRDNDDKQEFFHRKYNRLKSLFEFLSPDAFLKPYVRKFEWLTGFYIAFQKEFYGTEDAHVLDNYGNKVKKLIHDAVDYAGIVKNMRQLTINEIYELEKLKGASDEEKVVYMELAIVKEISEYMDVNPSFQSFSERLNQIKDEFENRQMDLSERLKEYEKMIADIKSEKEKADEIGMDMREYGLYMTIQDIVDIDDKLGLQEFVHQISATMIDLLDSGWKESTKKEFFVKEIKRILQGMIWQENKKILGGDVSKFSELMNRIFDVIVRKF